MSRAVIEVDGVAAGTGRQGDVRAADVNRVIVRPRVDRAVTRRTDRVTARPGVDRPVITATDIVVAVAALDGRIDAATIDDVIARAAVDGRVGIVGINT